MVDEVKEFARGLADTPPCECPFAKGDVVTFTNEYGVAFEGLRVIGFEPVIDPDHMPDRFIYLDKDSYWFPAEVSRLTLEGAANASNPETLSQRSKRDLFEGMNTAEQAMNLLARDPRVRIEGQSVCFYRKCAGAGTVSDGTRCISVRLCERHRYALVSLGWENVAIDHRDTWEQPERMVARIIEAVDTFERDCRKEYGL